jgi:hypothetical protein
MIIKKFKHFESVNFDDFPSLDEVKECFYDLTDEISSNIHTYQAGYKFWLKPHRVGEPYTNIIKDESNFIDILETDISDKKLSMFSNYARVFNYKGSEHAENELALKTIRDGAKAYRHIMLNFSHNYNDYEQSLLNLDQYDLLLNCLLLFYKHTEFRPYGDIWTEDYLRKLNNQNTGEIETKYGFHGLLVDCSDEEYLKISKLNTSYTGNKNLIKNFIK